MGARWQHGSIIQWVMDRNNQIVITHIPISNTKWWLITTEQRYPNLCSACRDPFRCSDGDEYSGFEGTLRCVTQGLGQVAWTSYTTVRRLFGVWIIPIQHISFFKNWIVYALIVDGYCHSTERDSQLQFPLSGRWSSTIDVTISVRLVSQTVECLHDPESHCSVGWFHHKN